MTSTVLFTTAWNLSHCVSKHADVPVCLHNHVHVNIWVTICRPNDFDICHLLFISLCHTKDRKHSTCQDSTANTQRGFTVLPGFRLSGLGVLHSSLLVSELREEVTEESVMSKTGRDGDADGWSFLRREGSDTNQTAEVGRKPGLALRAGAWCLLYDNVTRALLKADTQQSLSFS